MPPWSVAIADDHPIVLHGVRGILDEIPASALAGTAVSRAEAMKLCSDRNVDILLLDLRLGDTLAPDFMDALAELFPAMKVVILTAFVDPALLEACLGRGARGVLLKDASGLDLVSSLRSIAAGEIVVDSRLRTPRVEREDDGRYLEGGFDRLSEREHEVLRLLSRGLNPREIAAELGLMTNTVRSYVQQILEKLQSKNRVMALATARKLRLI